MANFGISPLSDSLHVLISVALVGTVYFCMMACWCRGGGPQQLPMSERGETQITVENPMVEPIPAHKHQKRKGLVGEDGMCAICLCEFEEGEELRTLPECLHSYHMPCIDMWLYSHSSCPMCRSRAMPSSFVLGRLYESKSEIASTH